MSKDIRGFTLMELLVVIAIIGMLASIVLASLNHARMKSRDARRVADIKELRNALELYVDDHPNALPRCDAPGYSGGCDLTTLHGDPVLVDSSQDSTFVTFLSPYIHTIPLDPINTGDSMYGYATGEYPTGSGTYYRFLIGAILEDPNNPALQSSYPVDIPNSETFFTIAEPCPSATYC